MPSHKPSGSSVPRRQLGARLRRMRQDRGLSVEFAAIQIERARPTLWKMETGQPDVRILNKDIKGLCELYRASLHTTAELLALAEASRVKGWTSTFADVLPPHTNMLVGLEEEASEIYGYERDLIPGFLQTEAYARAIFRIANPDEGMRSEKDVERRVELRLRRQEFLVRSEPTPAQCDMILDEAVLRRPIDGGAIMSDQLRHLNKLGERGNISVRVMPFDAGAHHGLVSQSFCVLRFPEGSGSPIVYMDGFLSPQYFDRDKDISNYDFAFNRIQERALDIGASRGLIEHVAEELSDHA